MKSGLTCVSRDTVVMSSVPSRRFFLFISRKSGSHFLRQSRNCALQSLPAADAAFRQATWVRKTSFCHLLLFPMIAARVEGTRNIKHEIGNKVLIDEVHIRGAAVWLGILRSKSTSKVSSWVGHRYGVMLTSLTNVLNQR